MHFILLKVVIFAYLHGFERQLGTELLKYPSKAIPAEGRTLNRANKTLFSDLCIPTKLLSGLVKISLSR